MRRKVVIIGGGVAGLTAAHELIERGFDVTVFERRERIGGKAASKNDEQRGLPAEHGFRFFPGWYRHIPDTMKRIHYKDAVRTVFDNLVQADINLLASSDRDPIEAVLRFPKNWSELRAIASFPQQLLRLGLTGDDIVFFFRKLAEYALTPESQRVEKYDKLTWWAFMEAEQRSRTFRQYLVDGLTRNTIAAIPTEVSAHTVAQVALRTLLDTLMPDTMVDRVLNGPTTEVWIEPWREYLVERGVDIITEAELDSFSFVRDKVGSVRVRLHRLKRAVARARLKALSSLEQRADVSSDLDELRALIDRRQELFLSGRGAEVSSATCARDPWLERHYHDTWHDHQTLLLEDAEHTISADYFILAIPVEQAAYFVNRSPELRRRDPALINLIALSEDVAWMSGIQFYLTEEVKVTRGHIDLLDSEWRLTAISQLQFWPDVDMKERGHGEFRGKVKAILSVDVSAWDLPGILHRKPAFACTRQEIAEEVWHQLKRGLNRPGRARILQDAMLLGARPHRSDAVPTDSYCLDDDIVERLDRKKQALYQRFESVRFSTEAAAGRRTAGTSGFAFGDRLQMNIEPLLVNRVGSWPLRPTAKTAIANLMLAGDYVQTTTNIATMEAANESARRAVNEILMDSGYRGALCTLWPLWPATDALVSLLRVFGASDGNLLDGRIAAAAPLQFASEAAAAASGLAQRMIGRFMTRRN